MLKSCTKWEFYSSEMQPAQQSKLCAGQSSAGLGSPSEAAGTNSWLRREPHCPGGSTPGSAFKKNGKPLTAYFPTWWSSLLISFAEMKCHLFRWVGRVFVLYEILRVHPNTWNFEKYKMELLKLNRTNSTCSSTLSMELSWHSKYQLLPTRKELSKNAWGSCALPGLTASGLPEGQVLH